MGFRTVYGSLVGIVSAFASLSIAVICRAVLMPIPLIVVNCCSETSKFRGRWKLFKKLLDRVAVLLLPEGLG